MQIAALIGISLVGGFVGGMIARGAAGLMMGTGGAAAMEGLSLGGTIIARGAGLVAETAIQSAGQSLIFGDKLSTAFLENMIMNLGTAGVLKALGSKVEEAAKLEKATASFWQKGAAAGKVVIKETAAITGHAIMGMAMGYVAHKIVTGKSQPPPETLEEWLMQGAGIAVGRYVGKAMEASHARQQRLKLKNLEQAKKLSTETEKIAELAKRVESDPHAKDAMELLQKRHEHLTEELKLLEEIEKSPELRKQTKMTAGELKAAKGQITHQLADVHSQGMGDVPLHLAGMHELIPGALWSGTEKQIQDAIHTARESGIDIKAKPDPQGGKWHLEIEGRKVEVEQRFEGRDKPYTQKEVGAHAVPGSGFTGIRPHGETKAVFTEREVAVHTKGAIDILTAGESGFGSVISTGDNHLLITNGSKQVRARVVIGEPMSQVATHDYNPAAQLKPGQIPEITITVSKEARPQDIMRATAHEIAEIQHLLVDPTAVHGDSLAKGERGEKLSGHDAGRIAELKVLLYELDNAPTQTQGKDIRNEINKLLEHLGIDKNTAATNDRLKRILGPDLTKRIDQIAAKRLKLPLSALHVSADPPARGQWNFKVEVDIPGLKERAILAQGSVMVDGAGHPQGSPTYVLDKRVDLGSSEHRIDVDGVTSLSDFALNQGNLAFEKQFGHPPSEMKGSLADDNKAIFHREYVAQIDKGVDVATAREAAARATPFAKARARLGYTNVKVTPPKTTKTITMGIPPRLVDVPVTIEITATKP
ncbi:MAG: hypothetical protein ABI867_08225 [Kofleriaceae bacterium]